MPFASHGPLSLLKTINVRSVQPQLAHRRHDLAHAPIHFLHPIAVKAVGGFPAKLLARMQRDMHRRVRQIEEERMVLVFAG